MLERVRTEQELTTELKYTHLSVPKAIALLDKLYDTFFAAPRKPHVRFFTKPYIKIEFLDNNWRPIFKEFDEWPSLSLDPHASRDIRKEKEKEKREVIENNTVTALVTNNNNIGQKMTRKSRPRIKEKDEKEPKGGYCEMCNTDYVDATLHRRSPHHLAFVRDHTNFMALDSLIGDEANVKAFLDKTSPVNGERRSLRKICNGDSEPKRRSQRSQSPDSTVNGDQSPKRNGIDEDKKRKRLSRKDLEESQYYKVVGVSTKLRSSGGFKKKESPTCNGTKPLVVKFKKVRRSELSVLSDEAEQFMFPKRASSSSSTSSTDDEKVLSPKQKSPIQQPPPPSLERRRLARPLALKEESSEEDWPDMSRKRKRKGQFVAKRSRRVPKRIVFDSKPIEAPPEPEEIETPVEETPLEETPVVEPEISPLREEDVERCMKWEDGRLKYTPAVEQLEFAFEFVPQSEPWFSTFKRQDKDQVTTKNIPRYFELYSTSKAPKLPYEIGQLPPLKPNCCPLSDLVKRDDKPGPSRSYGTRGMKKQRMTKKRIAAILALEGQPRKSPREHASTLAILGSAGLLHRRKNTEDTKSTASEDTVSETLSNVKIEPVIPETHEVSERLQQFLSEVFEDVADYELSEDAIEGEAAVTTSTNAPDVLSLVWECENCDIIRKDIQERSANRAKGRRGRLKKNRTGWPKKKKASVSRANSLDTEHKNESSMDGSLLEPLDDETTQDTISEANFSETEDKTVEEKPKLEDSHESISMDVDNEDSLQLSIVKARNRKHKRTSRSSASEAEEKEERPRKRSRIMQELCMQPVVRVARVDPNAARQLRSSGTVIVNRTRTNRTR